MLTNKTKKKSTHTILLILVCCIGVVNLFKTFTLDNHLKEAKSALKEAKNQIENAKLLTKEVKDELLIAKMQLLKNEVLNKQLQLEIDSISLVKKAKAPKDWQERLAIKKKLEEISLELLLLRKKDKEFE